MKEVENHIPLRVLKALLKGFPVEIGDYTYKMSIDFDVVTVAKNMRTDEEVYLNTGMSVQYFLKMCKDMTEDEKLKLSLMATLNE